MKLIASFLGLLIGLSVQAQTAFINSGQVVFTNSGMAVLQVPASGGGGSISVVSTTAIGPVGSQTTGHITVSPVVGHLLVILTACYSTAVANTVVTDNMGDSWTAIPSGGVNVGANYNNSLFYLKNCPAGITWVQIDGGSGGGNAEGFMMEISGCSTTAPLTTGEYASGSVASTANPQTASVNYATAVSIAICNYGDELSAGTFSATINSTGSSPASWIQSGIISDCNNYQCQLVTYYISTSSGSVKQGITTGSAQASGYELAVFH